MRTLQKALERAAELKGYRKFILEYGHHSDETAYTVLLADEVESLRAQLKWFEDREPLIRQGLKDESFSNGYDCCYEWSIVDKWEQENPKP